MGLVRQEVGLDHLVALDHINMHYKSLVGSLLEAPCWRLPVGGSQLEAPCWRLPVGGSQILYPPEEGVIIDFLGLLS